MWNKKSVMPTPDSSLAGRDTPIFIPGSHFVNKRALSAPYPESFQTVMFGMGCFWGAEKCFWQMDGVHVTAVGYAAGFTPNPTYQEVCSGMTGHNEVVLVVFDPRRVSFATLLKKFWESHDPTQGMRQGNDVGTQYRSGIYCSNAEQIAQAKSSLERYQQRLLKAGYSTITTEILPLTTFYFAEEYHQQYLAKNPLGYCGLGGTRVTIDEGDSR